MPHPAPYLSTYAQWEAPQEGTPPFRTMTKPIITAVNGICCGAGLDWVTTGDITIASDQATFFDPHVSIGLVSGREMVRLARVLPDRRRHAHGPRSASTSGCRAQRAYELGLITEVVEHDRLLERAHELAALVNRNAPLAVRGTRLADPQDARPARCTRPRSSPRRSGSGWCAPTTPRRAPRAFMEKRDPKWTAP